MDSKQALIVIDVQVGLFADPNTPVYQAESLIENIQILIAKARAAQVPIIFVQHTETGDSPLVKDSPGWAIHPALDVEASDIRIAKTTPDSFYETPLQEILARLKTDRLVIAGLQTEYCIDTTCRRAASLGYQTSLVQDAHATMDSPILSAKQIIAHHNQVLGSGFVRLASTREIRF